MSSNSRVFNLRGFSMKRSAAEKAIRECAAVWVEVGVSVRNLTLQESIDARAVQAKLAAPLPYAEVAGLRYEPSARGIEATRREGYLMWQAHDFVMGATA